MGQMTDPANTHLSSPESATLPRANAENEVLTQKVQKVQNVPWVCRPLRKSRELNQSSEATKLQHSLERIFSVRSVHI